LAAHTHTHTNTHTHTQVEAVEFIRTNDFTILADVGFAQDPYTKGRRALMANDAKNDVFSKLFPISATDIQDKIAGVQCSVCVSALESVCMSVYVCVWYVCA
jgi:hypothetical protein